MSRKIEREKERGDTFTIPSSGKTSTGKSQRIAGVHLAKGRPKKKKEKNLAIMWEEKLSFPPQGTDKRRPRSRSLKIARCPIS